MRQNVYVLVWGSPPQGPFCVLHSLPSICSKAGSGLWVFSRQSPDSSSFRSEPHESKPGTVLTVRHHAWTLCADAWRRGSLRRRQKPDRISECWVQDTRLRLACEASTPSLVVRGMRAVRRRGCEIRGPKQLFEFLNSAIR